MDPAALDSHRVRLTLAEKGIDASVQALDPNALPHAIREISPNSELPVMVDRDLGLHGGPVIVEYIDERYPHPPFLPMDPISRARARQAARRIEQDFWALAPLGADSAAVAADKAARLGKALTEDDELFAAMPFFLSESYSFLDAMLAPLLWRLPHYGIVLDERAGGVSSYARRMLARPGFRASLDMMENETGA